MCGLPSVQSGIRVHSSMTDGYQFPLAEAVGVQLPSPLSEGMEYGKAVMRSVGRALRVLLRDHETYDLSLPMLPISLPLFTPPDILWLLVHTGDNVFLDILRIVMFTMRRGCQDTIRGIVLSLLLSRVTDEMLTRRASFEQQEDDDWIMEGPSSAGTADAAQAESRGHAELLLSRAEESTPIVRDKGKGRAAGERNEEANILELRLEEPTEEDEALSEEMEVDDEDQEDEGAEASTTSKAKGREVNDEDQEGGGAELDTTSKAEDEGRSFQHAEQDLFVPPEPSWAWHVWALEQRLRVEGNRWRLIKGDARLPRDLQPVAWEEIRALLPASPIP